MALLGYIYWYTGKAKAMPRKCSIGLCKSNYNSVNHPRISIFRFPHTEEELDRWLSAIPHKIDKDKVTVNMGICARHWPDNFPTKRVKGRDVPAVPPTIFPPGAELYKRRPSNTSTSMKKVVNYFKSAGSNNGIVIPNEYINSAAKDNIPSTLVQLADLLKSKLFIHQHKLTYFMKDDCLHLLKLNDAYTVIDYSIHVNKSFHVTVNLAATDVEIHGGLLNEENKLLSWSQLKIIIQIMENLRKNPGS